jgi:hypothetical protein
MMAPEPDSHEYPLMTVFNMSKYGKNGHGQILVYQQLSESGLSIIAAKKMDYPAGQCPFS